VGTKEQFLSGMPALQLQAWSTCISRLDKLAVNGFYTAAAAALLVVAIMTRFATSVALPLSFVLATHPWDPWRLCRGVCAAPTPLHHRTGCM